jgi:hypothetical protein
MVFISKFTTHVIQSRNTQSRVSKRHDKQSSESLSWQAAAWVMTCKSLSWQAVTWAIVMTSRHVSHRRDKQPCESWFVVTSNHVSNNLSWQAVTWFTVMTSRHVSHRRDKQPCESWFVVSHCRDKQSRELCRESQCWSDSSSCLQNYKICDFLPGGGGPWIIIWK